MDTACSCCGRKSFECASQQLTVARWTHSWHRMGSGYAHGAPKTVHLAYHHSQTYFTTASPCTFRETVRESTPFAARRILEDCAKPGTMMLKAIDPPAHKGLQHS